MYFGIQRFILAPLKPTWVEEGTIPNITFHWLIRDWHIALGTMTSTKCAKVKLNHKNPGQFLGILGHLRDAWTSHNQNKFF